MHSTSTHSSTYPSNDCMSCSETHICNLGAKTCFACRVCAAKVSAARICSMTTNETFSTGLSADRHAYCLARVACGTHPYASNFQADIPPNSTPSTQLGTMDCGASRCIFCRSTYCPCQDHGSACPARRRTTSNPSCASHEQLTAKFIHTILTLETTVNR